MSPESITNTQKVNVLIDRARMLSQARAFFDQRQVLEVDCPIISHSASVDAHIDLIQAFYEQKTICFMHSSPEYGMKRLLAQGMGDIYQLSHVFRDGEFGRKHNPEFMMAEWYRVGFTFQQMIDETIDFTRLFLGQLPSTMISYREVFIQYAGFDYCKVSSNEIVAYLDTQEIDYSGIDTTDKEALLNLVLGVVIEPQLGTDSICALYHYPANQAALAQTKNVDGEAVAERFELYHQGIELANGYHELANAKEQRNRLIEANQERLRLNKPTLPIDEHFLQALQNGIPDCCGVAVGFDRLMLLRHHAQSIADVIPFDWASA